MSEHDEAIAAASRHILEHLEAKVAARLGPSVTVKLERRHADATALGKDVLGLVREAFASVEVELEALLGGLDVCTVRLGELASGEARRVVLFGSGGPTVAGDGGLVVLEMPFRSPDHALEVAKLLTEFACRVMSEGIAAQPEELPAALDEHHTAEARKSLLGRLARR